MSNIQTEELNAFERVVDRAGDAFARISYGTLEGVSTLLRASLEVPVTCIMFAPDIIMNLIREGKFKI